VNGKSNGHRGPVPFEQQLETLAECGISLGPGNSVDVLFEMYSRSAFENDPYKSLLIALGSESEEQPGKFFSSDIWYFDTECIEDCGAYTRIAMRLAELAGGDLPIAEVADDVDIEEGAASLLYS
jgi:hypothetical protein